MLTSRADSTAPQCSALILCRTIRHRTTSLRSSRQSESRRLSQVTLISQMDSQTASGVRNRSPTNTWALQRMKKQRLALTTSNWPKTTTLIRMVSSSTWIFLAPSGVKLWAVAARKTIETFLTTSCTWSLTNRTAPQILWPSRRFLRLRTSSSSHGQKTSRKRSRKWSRSTPLASRATLRRSISHRRM